MFVQVTPQFNLTTPATERCILYDSLSDCLGNELLHFPEGGAFPCVVRTDKNDDLVVIKSQYAAIGKGDGLERERGFLGFFVSRERVLCIGYCTCLVHLYRLS